MTTLESLHQQTADAYSWVNKLVKAVPEEKWEEIPEIIDSNLSWQVGHLVLSLYFHSVMNVVGHQPDIMEKLPIKKYSELFTYGPASASLGEFTVAKLKEHMALIQEKSLKTIKTLSADQLDQPLENTGIQHPIAKTKFQVLDWNIKHTMWHCGQIAMIKRVVYKPYDFGLRSKKQN